MQKRIHKYLSLVVQISFAITLAPLHCYAVQTTETTVGTCLQKFDAADAKCNKAYATQQRLRMGCLQSAEHDYHDCIEKVWPAMN